MALKATIYKATLQIADMDRQYYADHALTLACHPSETGERLMVRLLAFALFASDSLQFTRGISSEDEPDLWDKDLTGEIRHWIELGQPDPARVRKACHRARQVTIITFGDRAPPVWWKKHQEELSRFANLRVLHIPGEQCSALEQLLERNMALQVTIQDAQVWLGNSALSVEVMLAVWFPPAV